MSEVKVDEKVDQVRKECESLSLKKGDKEIEKNVECVLPQDKCRNILITSALPYVNNVPHLGNIVGSVLSGDVFARYCRLRGYQTLYIAGTDEYGTATETKAMEEKCTPQALCEKYYQLHKDTYDWFEIAFDKFGRTSTAEQTKICHEMFWDVYKNGYIFEEETQQLYCEKCARFLADRFVEGICPFCAYADARGDQCDKCGKLINAPDLKEPRCKTCTITPCLKGSKHLFLDLPKIEPQLKKWVEDSISNETNWSNTAKLITQAWLKEGLKPRCITRDLKWGSPVPLEGFTDKVFYVWFDAPIGYLSISANYTKEWERWWKNPENVQLYQFMAKDNVPFHSIIFPSTLLASGKKWTMMKNLEAVEYLNYDNNKFSKSRGIGIFGPDVKDTNIDADIWRFYLMYIRPESQDTSFAWEDLQQKNNFELLNNLGNFVNRTLSFVSTKFDGKIPPYACHELNNSDLEYLNDIDQEIKGYIKDLESVKLRDGIKRILAISRIGNIIFQSNSPWELIKKSDEEKKRCGVVVAFCANVVSCIALLLSPYMPNTSQKIYDQLKLEPMHLKEDSLCFPLNGGDEIGTPAPLFRRIEMTEIQTLKKKYSGEPEVKISKKAARKEAKEKKASAKAGNQLDGDKKASSDNVNSIEVKETNNKPEILKTTIVTSDEVLTKENHSKEQENNTTSNKNQ